VGGAVVGWWGVGGLGKWVDCVGGSWWVGLGRWLGSWTG